MQTTTAASRITNHRLVFYQLLRSSPYTLHFRLASGAVFPSLAMCIFLLLRRIAIVIRFHRSRAVPLLTMSMCLLLCRGWIVPLLIINPILCFSTGVRGFLVISAISPALHRKEMVLLLILYVFASPQECDCHQTIIIFFISGPSCLCLFVSLFYFIIQLCSYCFAHLFTHSFVYFSGITKVYNYFLAFFPTHNVLEVRVGGVGLHRFSFLLSK